jgi:hypothetical protein
MMAGDFNDPRNPYQSPFFGPEIAPKQSIRETVRGKVMAPAIFLLVVSLLGIAFSIFNCVFAMIADPPTIDPNAPEFLREMQLNTVGPVAAVVQGLFVALNTVILVGAIQMMRFRWWPWALTASILAMINFGTCCCVLGLPAGIWSLIVLFSQDVRTAFKTPYV